MLFSMIDTDLHCNLVWTELRGVYLEQRVYSFGQPTRVRVDNEGSWMSKAAAVFFLKGSVLLEPLPTRTLADRTEEATRGLKATTTATEMEHPAMGAQECLARAVAVSTTREDVRGTHRYSTHCEEHQTLHNRIRGTTQSTDRTGGQDLWQHNIKRMQDSVVNFLRWTYRSSCQGLERDKKRILQRSCSCLIHRNQKGQRERRIHRSTSTDPSQVLQDQEQVCGSVAQGQIPGCVEASRSLCHTCI